MTAMIRQLQEKLKIAFFLMNSFLQPKSSQHKAIITTLPLKQEKKPTS